MACSSAVSEPIAITAIMVSQYSASDRPDTNRANMGSTKPVRPSFRKYATYTTRSAPYRVTAA